MKKRYQTHQSLTIKPEIGHNKKHFSTGRWVWIPVLHLLVILLLAGCQSGPIMSFSAEQAAINAVTQQRGGRSMIDTQSIEVVQSMVLDERTFVQLYYEQVTDGRQEQCLAMYELDRSRLGTWSPRSGAGGCSSQVGGNPGDVPPLDIGGGQTGGSGMDDTGFSHVNGLVHQADIVQVRVTWSDGQQMVVPVINGSYMALRPGEFNFNTVEGLDQDGKVVFQQNLNVAPGKQP